MSQHYFEAEVTNLDSKSSDPRTISWYVCIGEQVTNVCISQKIDEGDIDVPFMAMEKQTNSLHKIHSIPMESIKQ